jgi:hypothetical protein
VTFRRYEKKQVETLDHKCTIELILIFEGSFAERGPCVWYIDRVSEIKMVYKKSKLVVSENNIPNFQPIKGFDIRI